MNPSSMQHKTDKEEILIIMCLGNLHGDITDKINGSHFSAASIRIQLLPAIKAANKLKIPTRVISISPEQDATELVGNPTVCIIGKISHYNPELHASLGVNILAAVGRVKRLGAKIILTYCDHMLERSKTLHNIYSTLIKHSNQIIVPTQKMRNLLNIPEDMCAVIEDPWQIEPQKILSIKKDIETPKLLWFGQSQNMQYLMEITDNILSNCILYEKYELTVLSSIDAISSFKNFLQNRTAQKQWVIRYSIWDNKKQPEQLLTHLRNADIALIPSSPNKKTKAGASHNRLVDCINGGCIAIASPLDSYLELEDVAYLTKNIAQAVDIVASQYHLHLENIKKKRTNLVQRFSPIQNERNWRKVIASNSRTSKQS